MFTETTEQIHVASQQVTNHNKPEGIFLHYCKKIVAKICYEGWFYIITIRSQLVRFELTSNFAIIDFLEKLQINRTNSFLLLRKKIVSILLVLSFSVTQNDLIWACDNNLETFVWTVMKTVEHYGENILILINCWIDMF